MPAQRTTINTITIAAAIAITATATISITGHTINTYREQTDTIHDVETQLDAVTGIVDDLRSEVARLNTDEGTIEAARIELGWTFPGEQRISITNTNTVPTELPDGWPYDLTTRIVELRRNNQ